MLTSLRNTIARIAGDLRAGRNIESYAVVAVAIALAAIGLVDDLVPDSVKLSVILAALALVVFGQTRPAEIRAGIEDYLHNRPELGPFAERVRHTRKLWIYGPSATNILDGDNLDLIRRGILSDPKGELRVLVQNPDAAEAVRVLKRQLDESVEFHHQDLPDEIGKTLRKFEAIRTWKTPGNFAYGLLEYSPGFSIAIFDPDRPTGTAVIELYGWRLQSTSERMSIEISQMASPRWFRYWVEQYEYMWADAAHPPTPDTPRSS
jgi:hypothetical protein